MDGRRNGSGNTGQANLTNAPGSERVEFEVGEVEEVNFDGWHVGVHRDYIVGEVAVERCTILGVVMGGLEQSHADSHDRGALNLVPTRQWIENTSCVDNRYNPADPQARDLRLPGYFDEVTSK